MTVLSFYLVLEGMAFKIVGGGGGGDVIRKMGFATPYSHDATPLAVQRTSDVGNVASKATVCVCLTRG